MIRSGAASLMRSFSVATEASLKPSGIVEIRETLLKPRHLQSYLEDASQRGQFPDDTSQARGGDTGLLGHFVSRAGGGLGRVTSIFAWEDHNHR